MKLNHESKNLIAMAALVGAVALALNEAVVAEDSQGFLIWSLGLLCVSVFFWLWMRRDSMAEQHGDAAEAAEEAAAQAEALAQRNERNRAETVAEADDLTKIKGIAEGYQQILNEAGIYTYADLAKTSLDDLKAIFGAVKIASPVRMETVPRQAEFAANEDWEGLRAFQDSL